MSLKGPPVTILLNERPLYELEWLEDFYKRVKFPNPKCEGLLVKVNRVLSRRISGEFDDQIKQQALFQLLGEDYVRIHFPHHRFNPELLEPPKTNPDVKMAYMKEMKHLLDEHLEMALEDLNFPTSFSSYEGKDQLGEFLGEVRKVFKQEFQRQVALVSEKSRVRDIEAGGASYAALNSNKLVEESPFRVLMNSGMVSGTGIVAVFRQSRQSLETVIEPFNEQFLMLPMPLRRIFWISKIYQEDYRDYDEPLKLDGFKSALKAATCKNGTSLGRVVRGPNYTKIYQDVIGVYHSTKHLRSRADEALMFEAAHIINAIDSLDKGYITAQILWLAPLQMIFFPEGEDDLENIREPDRLETNLIRLTSHLHAFSKNCALPWDKVYMITNSVIKVLVSKDTEYLEHIQATLAKGQPDEADPYQFTCQVLSSDPKKSAILWQELKKRNNSRTSARWTQDLKEALQKVDVYIHKWLGEAFVGILDAPLILYVWDFLAMNNWEPEAFKGMCILLLAMIRPWVMKAKVRSELVHALLGQPSRLYLADVRRAMQSYASKGPNIKELAKLNTNIEVVDKANK